MKLLDPGTPLSAKKISEISEKIKFSDIPDPVVEASKKFILDLLGCILGAKHVASSKIMAQVISNLGGNPQSTIIGYNHKTAAPMAALINSTTGHAFDMDDDHREGTLHCSVVVFPAVLSVAELNSSSGKDVITAYALGSEHMIRLGESFLGQTYFQGFHTTGTTGVFGAALGAGKILGLSVQQLTAALGIAGSQAAGLLAFGEDGTWTKRLQAGHPAMGGVFSALLARENYTGPGAIYDSMGGFIRAFSHKEQYDVSKVTDEFGSRWELLGNSIKPHACCRFSGPIVDCALEISKNNHIKPDEIKDVLVYANQWMITALTQPIEKKIKPVTEVDAQFSLPYATAIGLVKKRAFVTEFTEEALKDPEVLKITEKVRWELDPEFEKLYPKVYPARIVVTMNDGKKYTAQVDHPKGDPENPLSDAQIVEKFQSLVVGTISQDKADEIVDKVLNLEKLKSINELTGCLR